MADKKTAKAPKAAKQYRFVTGVNYAHKGDKRYEQNQIDTLEDWRKVDVRAALKNGTIVEVE